MEVSNVHLSSAEMELFSNAQIILTKNTIITKTILLLEELQFQMLAQKKTVEELFDIPPKITRGENYMGLPFVILDYPRKSEGGNLFFIRTMFWWGNFYSSTLHVSGSCKDRCYKKLKHEYHKLSQDHYYIGVNSDQWVHHFDETNFQLISSIGEETYDSYLGKHEHIKIACHWPLKEWSKAPNRLLKSWKFLLELVT
jgi:hypothetical protein